MKWQKGKLSELTPELFRNLYFDQKRTLQEIAEMYGASRAAVHKWFVWNMKDKSTQLRPRKVTRRTLESDFFEVWTPEMAYVLGLFVTDGNVGGKYRASLTSTDLELIKKVRSLMRTDHPVRRVPPRGFSRKTQYRLEISSMAVVKSLENLGVTARKSRTILFPRMPRDCVRHFLRGCWDGDGSFYYEKRGHNLRASYVSGSKEFIEAFAEALRDIGICKRAPNNGRKLEAAERISIYALNRSGSTSYSFRLTGENAISFGRFIYESVPETMYLKRKYEMFRNAVGEVMHPGHGVKENPTVTSFQSQFVPFP
jgi:intein/homing endonuclease